MKRLYLDALIESYVIYSQRSFDCLLDVNDEIQRLCKLQRDAGHKDYFERLAA